VEITAVEMDGQTVLMQDCPQCHGRGAVDLVDDGRKVWGAQCPECHGLRVDAVLGWPVTGPHSQRSAQRPLALGKESAGALG
jgi:cytochrome c5